MYRVTTVLHFCYGHRLLNYDGKCRHLHGHNGKVEVELASDRLDAREMLRDFGEIKQALKRWIDETFDHTMILRKDDPALPALRQLGERLCVIERNPTAEVLAQLIFEQARSLGFPVSAVRLWETDSSFAAYGV